MGKFICTDQTDIFFPDRFGTPASKPPLFHLTLCLTSKVFNIEIGPFLARLISIISTILALYFISQILSLNYLGTLFLSTLFYPIVDEAFSAKVDSLNFLIIWMSLYLYSKTKWKTVLSPVFGFLLYLSKGPYSIVAFAILSFALRLESVKQIMIHTIL
ncbi:MAG: hypothetical protein NZO16_06065, partial [Deltaproteobacteria bacterium]|nr:hypothetical protein [Deltaproteobacteria bacterium]